VLLDAGVVAYRDALVHAGEERLWPRLPLAKEGGYKRNSCRWYSEKFNRRSITEEKRKTFHSLRHTFATQMKSLKVEPLVQMELMGLPWLIDRCDRVPTFSAFTGGCLRSLVGWTQLPPPVDRRVCHSAR